MIQKFEFCNTDFEGAYLIKPFCATDIRGAFIKDYSKEVFEANGLEHNLAEVFYTVSHKGVIRALHFQRVHEQAKLVRCIKGKVLMLSLTSVPNHLHSKMAGILPFRRKYE